MAYIYNQIYKIVQKIPKGKVLTYGLISHMIGGRMSAQGVGWALKALGSGKSKKVFDSSNVPWHRVVNAQGGASTHKVGLPPDLQRQLLEAEGVKFNSEEKLDLEKHLWKEILTK